MNDFILQIDSLLFQYETLNEPTLKGIDLSIKRGEWIAVVGHNGSGKSTLARILNGLLMPTEGDVKVNGITLTEDTVWEVRKQIGMVFQNPDNQFVGSTVRDDVAFGLENIGTPRAEMVKRVDEAIKKVGMESFLNQEPHQLSGGQKQRVAIAGVMALQPAIIVLDEATSMLDPHGRLEVIQTLQELRAALGLTVLSITHDLEEATKADRIIVLNNGQIFAEGTPKEVFALGDKLVEIGLDLPFALKLRMELQNHGIVLEDTISNEGLMEELCKLK
ncbi:MULTISPECIES: energy-coupling factor ABC transporter ATP-binding protein [Bacillus]|uniref:energy-coupling factor ABC transporter ATP-binding protein n=1 Tax=Bacillus TaxID=1386 RepID=UPI000BB8B1FB|nr:MULTISPECIES: energy-coupling factor ABC transporter ATP-binding protein [Bacillus]